MPIGLMVLTVLGMIFTGCMTAVGVGLFFDSWAEGDKQATAAGLIVFFMGLTSLFAVMLPMMYISEHLKGVQ